MRLVEFKEIDKKNLALKESRIQHAEDLIFWEGSKGVARAIQQLEQLSKSTQSLTIKWDGSPAVVFGRNPNGEFIFTDKAGFVAKSYDGRATNPEDLKGAIMQRGKDPAKRKAQAQYASKMASVFDTVAKAVPENFQGYFVGDMLYFSTPKKAGSQFVFKPNVVEYRVDANSELGQKISQSKVGVVIHHTMSEAGKVLPIKDLEMIQGDVLAIPPTTVNKKQPIQVKTFGSGIIKADKTLHEERILTVVGYVLDMGEQCYSDKDRFPSGPWCKVGDCVVFRANSGTRLMVNGQEYRLMNDDSIEAVVADPRGISRA